MSTIMVYVTTPSTEISQEIAEYLVEKKLVACANIFNGIKSVYEWEGKVTSDEESLVIAKAPEENFKAIQEAILKKHPYECPCILGFSATKGFPPFLKWIETTTKI